MKFILALVFVSLFGFSVAALADNVVEEINPPGSSQEGIRTGHTNFSEEQERPGYATNPLAAHALDDTGDFEGAAPTDSPASAPGTDGSTH